MDSTLEPMLPPAAPGDPGIGVYALSQFAYCPRAGIITAEQADPEAENPAEIRRLDFQPQWSLIEVDNRLSQLVRTGWILIATVVGISLLTVMLLFLWPIPALILGLLSLTFFSWKLARIAAELFTLSILRHEVLSALPIEPVLPFTEPTPVNWWQMFQAGFVSREYFDKLSDDEARLTGKPWRVMQRGTIRIPVCRVRSESRVVRNSHIVRVAAYCHLIEFCTGLESPYGIVLWAGTFEGFAIPNSPKNRKLASRTIQSARRALLNASFTEPSPPRPHVCESCKIGFPKVYRRGHTETSIRGSTLPVFDSIGEDGRSYHSECGDRFCWIPPHERSEEKQLR